MVPHSRLHRHRGFCPLRCGLAYAGQYTLFAALVLAALPAVGGGIVRDLLLQRDPLAVVRDPEALLTVFGTVLAGMIVIKAMARVQAGLFTKYLQSRAHLGTRAIGGRASGWNPMRSPLV